MFIYLAKFFYGQLVSGVFYKTLNSVKIFKKIDGGTSIAYLNLFKE